MIRCQARLKIAGKKFRFHPLYSGGVLFIQNFENGLILDIGKLKKLPPKVKVCFDHDLDRIVGWMKPRIVSRNGQLEIAAEGEFEETSDALRILQEQKQGKVWECSISTAPFNRFRDTDVYGKGESVKVNGKTFYGPIRVLRDWELEEGSFVTKGGDAWNDVTIQARFLKTKGRKEMSEDLRQFILDAGMDPDAQTPEQILIWEQAYAESCRRAAANDSAEAEGGEEEKAPEEENAQAEGDPEEEENAQAEGEPEEEENAQAEGDPDEDPPEEKKEEQSTAGAKAKAKAKGKAGTKAKVKVNARAAKMRPGKVSRSVGAPKMEDIFKAVLLRNSGRFSEDRVKASLKTSDNVMSEALSSRFDGMSVKEMACAMLKQTTGREFRGTENDFVAAFFGFDRARASFSTMPPIALLENVLNVIYYETSRRVNPVLDQIVRKQMVKNFHDVKVASYDIYGLPPEQAENGRLTHATIIGEERDVSMSRKGNILTLTRDALINDQADAFLEVVAKLGLKHGRGRVKNGFKKILDALSDTSVFSETIGNRITAPLSINGLDAASHALAQMETQGSDPDDPDFTEFEGKFLLVPSTLAGTASQLFQAMNLVGTDAGTTLALTENYHQYIPLQSVYLDKGAHANGSSTGWFLLADPAEAALVVETRLSGASEPHIMEVPTESGIIGRSWATYFEYGFGILDHRAAVYSTGTGS